MSSVVVAADAAALASATAAGASVRHLRIHGGVNGSLIAAAAAAAPVGRAGSTTNSSNTIAPNGPIFPSLSTLQWLALQPPPAADAPATAAAPLDAVASIIRASPALKHLQIRQLFPPVEGGSLTALLHSLEGGTTVLMSEEDVTDFLMTDARVSLQDPVVTVTDMGDGIRQVDWQSRLAQVESLWLEAAEDDPSGSNEFDTVAASALQGFADTMPLLKRLRVEVVSSDLPQIVSLLPTWKNVEDVELVFKVDPDMDGAVSRTEAAALLRDELQQGRCDNLRRIRLASYSSRQSEYKMVFDWDVSEGGMLMSKRPGSDQLAVSIELPQLGDAVHGDEPSMWFS
ncbi:hypothetical protein DFJ73DRAFT_963012 [Zopfochytrium polystomum]|nr:hypothetical protein DFJ73DRAFT_963012 [Zopfochytrium polystomum]